MPLIENNNRINPSGEASTLFTDKPTGGGYESPTYKREPTYKRDDGDDKIGQLAYLVKQKVENHKAESAKSKLQAPYSKILLTFADGKDKLLITLGYITAIATGAGLPSFVFIFGDIVNTFGPNQNDIVS